MQWMIQKERKMISKYDQRIQPFIFDKELNNISLNKWNELYSNIDYVVIGRIRIKNILISTLWCGISASKLPFETCIFIGDDCMHDQRHASQREAEEYHLTKVKFYLSLDELGGLPASMEALSEENHS
jgi:hypothetical protein